MSGDSILDEDAPDRANKPSTIAARRIYLNLSGGRDAARRIKAGT